jgi:hypothetical protein
VSFVLSNLINNTDPTGHMIDWGCQTEGCNLPEGLSSSTTYSIIYPHDTQINYFTDENLFFATEKFVAELYSPHSAPQNSGFWEYRVI